MKKILTFLLVALLIFSNTFTNEVYARSNYGNKLYLTKLYGKKTTPAAWAQDGINEAVKNKLTSNIYFKGRYNQNITRKEFCILVVNMIERFDQEKVEKAYGANNPFRDTKNKSVIAASKLGIVNGIDKNHFAPDKLVTRAQIAAMMMRAAGKLDAFKNTSYVSNVNIKGVGFRDERDIPKYALNDIKRLNKLGIMKGVGNNTIQPNRNAQIQEAILLVNRMYKDYTKYSKVKLKFRPKDDVITFEVNEQGLKEIKWTDLFVEGFKPVVKKINGKDIKPGQGRNLKFGKVTVSGVDKLQYKSRDVKQTSVDEFNTTFQDRKTKATAEVKIIIKTVTEGKDNIVIDCIGGKCKDIQLSQISKGNLNNGTKIVSVDEIRSKGTKPKGKITISKDGHSFKYESFKVTKNETVKLAVKVSDSKKNIQVTLNIKEPTNSAPVKNYKTKYFDVDIDKYRGDKAEISYVTIVQDDDEDDDLKVVSIVPDPAYGSDDFECIVGFKEVPGAGGKKYKQKVLIIKPKNKKHRPNSVSKQRFKVVFSDGTESVATKIQVKKEWADG